MLGGVLLMPPYKNGTNDAGSEIGEPNKRTEAELLPCLQNQQQLGGPDFQHADNSPPQQVNLFFNHDPRHAE
jgi:hypothetical protein